VGPRASISPLVASLSDPHSKNAASRPYALTTSLVAHQAGPGHHPFDVSEQSRGKRGAAQDSTVGNRMCSPWSCTRTR